MEIPVKSLKGVALWFALATSIAVFALQNSLQGKWTTTIQVNGQHVAIEGVYGPEGHYSEIVRSGSLMTSQSGTFLFRDGTVYRTVKNWEPKRQWIAGAAPGTGHWEDTKQPPGGVFRVTFTNADTTVWDDVNTRGSTTFHRVR